MAEEEVFSNLNQNADWKEQIPTPLLNSRYFESGLPTQELESVKQKLINVFSGNQDYQDQIQGIFVVGSQAVGRAREDSDLDVLVLTNNLEFTKGDVRSITLNQTVNNHIPPDKIVAFLEGKEGSKEIKKDLVEVFVRSYGFGQSFDLLNSSWVKLDKS